MAYQIFISYRRNGGEALAYLLNEKLTNIGYSVFYDIESLASGKFNDKLFEVIDSCEDVIVVLPPNGLDRCSDENDWVRLEVAYALEKKKNLIPVMMNGFFWPEHMPENIADLKNYNGLTVTFEFFDGFIQKLQKDFAVNSGKRPESVEKKDLKHVLMWADFDRGSLSKIINKMDLDSSYYVEVMEEPVEMLSKNLQAIDSIVLFVTDVTKLSNNDYVLEKINTALAEYVENGGRLIGAHDLIYRRTRNGKLQEIFGCKISNFKQLSDVKYYKTESCKEDGNFLALPDEFTLRDDEICWGQTAPDIDVFFETEDGIPLVFGREYGRGMCIWFNSGDFKDYPSKSLLKPQDNFVLLLKEMLKFEY